MVLLGYENNGLVSCFYKRTSGAIKRDARGLPSLDIVLEVH